MTVMCTGYHSLLQTFIAFGASINGVTIFARGRGQKLRKKMIHTLVSGINVATGKNVVLHLNKFSSRILFTQPPDQFLEDRYFFKN